MFNLKNTTLKKQHMKNVTEQFFKMKTDFPVLQNCPPRKQRCLTSQTLSNPHNMARKESRGCRAGSRAAIWDEVSHRPGTSANSQPSTGSSPTLTGFRGGIQSRGSQLLRVPWTVAHSAYDLTTLPALRQSPGVPLIRIL